MAAKPKPTAGQLGSIVAGAVAGAAVGFGLLGGGIIGGAIVGVGAALGGIPYSRAVQRQRDAG